MNPFVSGNHSVITSRCSPNGYITQIRNRTVIERAQNQWNGWPGLPMLAKVTTISALTSMMMVVSGCNANKSEGLKKAETVQEISVSTRTVAEESLDVVRELPGTTSNEFHSVLATVFLAG